LSKRKLVFRGTGAGRQPAGPTTAQKSEATTGAGDPSSAPDRSPRLALPPAAPRSHGWRARTAVPPRRSILCRAKRTLLPSCQGSFGRNVDASLRRTSTHASTHSSQMNTVGPAINLRTWRIALAAKGAIKDIYCVMIVHGMPVHQPGALAWSSRPGASVV